MMLTYILLLNSSFNLTIIINMVYNSSLYKKNVIMHAIPIFFRYNMATDFDFIVIGAGINGLTAASYLAKEGFSTIIIEKQDYLGGCAVTKELTIPGFKHDVFATSINIWRLGPVEKELNLRKYGYRDLSPEVVASTPFKNGRAITIYNDINKTANSIAGFSKKDADRYKEVYDYYNTASELVEEGFAAAPMKYSEMTTLLEDTDDGLEFLRLSFMSVRDWLNENFESEEVKAFFTIWATNHAPLSPEDAGSALTALTFVGLLQQKGIGIPIGGMEILPNSLRNFIQAHDGKIITGDSVDEIFVENNIAKGVKLRSGKLINAKKGILANVEPKALFNKLIPPSKVSESFLKKVNKFRYSEVTQVMIHAAMSEAPDYISEDTRKAGIVQIGETVNEISRAFNDSTIGRLPDRPFMTLNNSTYYDKSRSPEGKHTMWNFVRAPVMIGGKPWTEDDKEKFAAISLARLAEYAPNISKSVLKMVVMSPQDIEALNPNVINGDPVLGKPSIDQMLSLRPFPGYSKYRTEINGLYMCSSATHPGGGVSGLPGRNAALQAIEDLKMRA